MRSDAVAGLVSYSLGGYGLGHCGGLWIGLNMNWRVRTCTLVFSFA